MNEGLRAFGRRLKELLAEKGVSVDDISKATKIRTVFLDALLSGKREDLPDDVFVIGYLRAMLGYLHVNPEAWIDEYKALSRPAETQESEISGNSFTPVPEIRTKSHFMLWALLVLAMVACSGLYLFRGSLAGMKDSLIGSGPEKEFDAGAAPGVRETLPQDPGMQANTDGGAEKAGGEKPAVKISGPDAEEDLKPKAGLEIVALSRCWVEITSEGEGHPVIIRRELPAGETVTCPGIVTYRVTLGDASAVNVFFNGKEVVFEKAKGKVLRDMVVGEEKK